MIRSFMFFILNWGYLVAALWIIGGLAVYQFLPIPRVRGQILMACIIIGAAHIWSAMIFRDGVAYQTELNDRATIIEAERQTKILDAAQAEGAKTVIALEMEREANAKLQGSYDSLSASFNTKQCLAPEQLRRIQQTGKPSRR